MAIKHQLGLIGYPLSHSFSKKYFADKFEKEQIEGYNYELFPLEKIGDLSDLLDAHSNLLGINITIPYKREALPFLDAIDEEAEKVGAINTIKIKNGQLKGYNTDIYGFEISLKKLIATATLPFNQMNALVLGTGGAAQAVIYVLDKLGINYQLVSRSKGEGRITYQDIDKKCLEKHQILINTTPLGTFPNIKSAPNLPYQYLSNQHFLYDLVYNPEVTEFLNRGLIKGAKIRNGLEMLHLQAEKSWSIWTEEE